MKWIIVFLASVGVLFATDLKMKEVQSLAKNNSNVMIVDKKEFEKYINEQKLQKAKEEAKKDISFTSNTIKERFFEPSAPVVEEYQSDNKEVAKQKEKVVIDGLDSFKSTVLLLGQGRDIKVEYKVGLLEALEITKYIHSLNMQKQWYEPIKKVLLDEGKKLNDIIDYETFSDAVENMSEMVAQDMINEFKLI